MSESVTNLIWQAAGAPPMPGSTPGVCRACGAAGVGLPFGRWVRDTFTDRDKLLPGDIICHACLFSFEEASPLLTERTGKDKPQRMRNYSHFVTGGVWTPLSKGQKREMVALLRREPEVVVIATSGQKHIIFRARPGWWQIEEKSSPAFPGALWPLLEVVEALYNGGFGKEEIETGRYTNQRRIIEFGLAEYLRLEAAVRAARGTLALQLAVYLAQKTEEVAGDEEGHDGGRDDSRVRGVRGVPGEIPSGVGAADLPVAGNTSGLQEEVRPQYLAAVRGQHPGRGLHGDGEPVRQLVLFPDERGDSE